VCRVAGNFLNTDVVASFEYTVSVLNTPLLMVLGHRSCGAVDAAIQIDPRRHHAAGSSALAGRGDRARRQGHAGQAGGTPSTTPSSRTFVSNVERLKAATPIIEMYVAEKKVRVVGAIYNLGGWRDRTAALSPSALDTASATR